MSPEELNIHSVLIRNSTQPFTDVDEEIIMLNVKHSEYYNLSGTAGIIWNYLAKPATLKELIVHLTSEFEISFEDCLSDIQPFIQELLNKKIVQVFDE